MIKCNHYLWVLVFLLTSVNALSSVVPISEASRECLECHTVFQPGIVEDWKQSRHAAVTPKQAGAFKGPARKVSAGTIPEMLQTVVVGCAECHTLRPDKHSDHVEHNGHEIHIVVSPADCATCHATEADQYAKNIMSHAYKNLAGNPVYQDLQRTIIGKPVIKQGSVHFDPPGEATRDESCYYCHGTRLAVTGFETRDTVMGEVTLPQISGWPNQGVGRLNLDGSRGACTACHTRHGFSIEMARKPYTCKQCHVGPDVPAFKVYMSSKHGNIFASMNKCWDFNNVPWTIGRDFTAPTCATCHISLLVNTEGDILVNRTHQINDRLSWRIFGLTYAHPQPREPDTTIIKNGDGLPLATDFSGGFAKGFLLDPANQKSRTETMQTVCLACHDPSWVQTHFKRYENVIRETNAATLTATEIMMNIWKSGHAVGIDRGGSPFDEAVEKKWTDIWLFYANTIRFSAAMAGGGDFGVFADGRYHLSKGIQELSDWLKSREGLLSAKERPPKEEPSK